MGAMSSWNLFGGNSGPMEDQLVQNAKVQAAQAAVKPPTLTSTMVAQGQDAAQAAVSTPKGAAATVFSAQNALPGGLLSSGSSYSQRMLLGS